MRSLLNFLLRYKTLILFLFLEGLALVMLTSSHNYHQTISSNIARSISGRLSDRMENYRSYFKLREMNRQLISENLALRQRLEDLEIPPEQYFVSVDDTVTNQRYRYIGARIVNNSVNKQKNFITLDKGRNQGITTGMAVVGAEGVIGVTVGVSPNYSVAMSLLNNDFRLSASINKSDYFGSLAWDGHDYRYALLSEIPHHVIVNQGDTIVTSGYSAIFPRGLIVGTLTGEQRKSGDFNTLQVALSADFKKLTNVYIIANLERGERNKLEEEVTGE